MTVNPKKHTISDADEDEDEYIDRSGKRVKLLINNLSLDDKQLPLKSRQYVINPEIHLFDETSLKNKPSYTGSNLTSKLNGIMADHFQKVLLSGLQLIRWYDYRFVIIYRYKRWFVKLWNRFVKKYNERNGLFIRPFTSLEQIMKLIQDNLITSTDLTNIITQENELQIKKLQLKEEIRNLDKKFEEISSENEALRDIKYNYWDNLKFDKDLDMLDVSNDDDLLDPNIDQVEDDSSMEL